MGKGSSVALRGLHFFIRIVHLLCAIIVLALFSYFLATLSNHSLPIHNWVRAVEGISGAAVLYGIVSTLLLWCFPGRQFPSFLTMMFDVAFAVAFIYVSVANRGGAGNCTGEVKTVFGTGQADQKVVGKEGDNLTPLPKSLGQACKIQTACLAVSIISIFFYLFSLPITLAIVRNRKRSELKPAPILPDNIDNSSTTQRKGGLKGWLYSSLGRNKRTAAGDAAALNPNALPNHPTPDDVRNSYTTEQTRVDSNNNNTATGYASLDQMDNYKYGDQYENRYDQPGNIYGGETYEMNQAGRNPYGSQHYENSGVYR
ncbi:uncharacterized protein CTHT_0065350 [Thermochaetoides thermophila DSM 1495]|uniref:MARVEL domain-containing protein n=1 Tax=Chaetomium thermophilum (strain DSM 1495 / CBS 144.50 / IMI 039719) TaxID=759272 RepID=G0SG78_CHATD|nr:hypothetical protein CTHT_0065350 [Thermochaetoides thermophila DSM 1495]EGS17217.1 hypothetical protein CTHT_0065350 [Thermochaetoides thermophila DSM 1495]